MQNLLPDDHVLVKTKYFTARISSLVLGSTSSTVRDPDKIKRQTTYLEALETLSDFDIIYGHYHHKTIRCPQYGSYDPKKINCPERGNFQMPEEKMTDVNIAVEVMVDVFQDNFDTAFIVSGDGDLAGLVRKCRQLNPEKVVAIVFPPKRWADALKREANYSFRIGRRNLAKSQFPENVTKKDGTILERPDSWK